MRIEEKIEKEKELLVAIMEHKEEILEMKEKCEGYYIEDRFYRYYHQSFKVFDLQEITQQCFSLFRKLEPLETGLNRYFLNIMGEGTYKEFTRSANGRWEYETRPILEAFFHSKMLLELIIKYGINGNDKKRSGNPGWYAVLYLYNIR